jgi:hypothetical protein
LQHLYYFLQQHSAIIKQQGIHRQQQQGTRLFSCSRAGLECCLACCSKVQ